jgi:hypothetical protein
MLMIVFVKQIDILTTSEFLLRAPRFAPLCYSVEDGMINFLSILTLELPTRFSCPEKKFRSVLSASTAQSMLGKGILDYILRGIGLMAFTHALGDE